MTDVIVMTPDSSDGDLHATVLRAGTVVHFHGYPVRLLATVTVGASQSGIEVVNRELAHYRQSALPEDGR